MKMTLITLSLSLFLAGCMHGGMHRGSCCGHESRKEKCATDCDKKCGDDCKNKKHEGCNLESEPKSEKDKADQKGKK